MKRKQKTKTPAIQTQLRLGSAHPFGALRQYVPMGGGEAQVYRDLREALPILDGAVQKLVRLTGGFRVRCPDKEAERRLSLFLRTVPCGRGQFGIDSFLAAYLDSLLTYGRSVGEMVVSRGRLRALCWGDVTKVEIREGDSPLDIAICAPDETGKMRVLPYQNLLLFTPLNPEPASPYGVSLFRGMPFLAEILLKIYHTVGVNWERAGNVRYSVVYKPQEETLDGATAQERGAQIAGQWTRAMEESRSGGVRDFVAVGDVDIKVIGADGKILDSQVPVRQILEQLVARTGLPPFLLGLSWSATERMSTQQSDLLTTELWALRRAVTPALERICRTYLRLEGFGCEAEILWDDISLQDLVEEAQAGLYKAQAKKIQRETEGAEA